MVRERLINKHIRIRKIHQKKLNAIMKAGEFITEVDLIRKALEIGLDELDKSK